VKDTGEQIKQKVREADAKKREGQGAIVHKKVQIGK